MTIFMLDLAGWLMMTHSMNILPRHENDLIDIDIWLQQLPLKKKPSHALRQACLISQNFASSCGFGDMSCLEQGLNLATLIAQLQLDQETMVAAILYNGVCYGGLKLDDICDKFSPRLITLVKNVQQLGSLTQLHQVSNDRQIDNLRRMLLAIVRDVRVIVIKLGERLCMMRAMKTSKSYKVAETFNQLAKETMTVYAPLANRLGIHQLRWELEDISFYFLHYQIYKHIAKQLHLRRLEREKVISQIISDLKLALKKAHIKANIYGRAKHIYSIYCKMQRKRVNFDQIYDAHAIRVITLNQSDCYQVLSIIHDLWPPITDEFDDYIRNPKTNGYQSIHTAVRIKHARYFEAQIRTQQMHRDSEKGVAAHWLYKEGNKHKGESYEQQIIWLRQLLAWQRDVGDKSLPANDVEKRILEERVYVFTPNGEIIDLPVGATPLDFAYIIHTEIGHRCRGARVNSKLVSLTYQLKTGEQVEILTSKVSQPSRDWLMRKSGYLKTTKARGKVAHWFKQQDIKQYVQDGKAILEREIQRLNLQGASYDRVAHQLNYKSTETMLAALGSGDLRLATIIHQIEHTVRKYPEATLATKDYKLSTKRASHQSKDNGTTNTHIEVCGSSHFVTRIANCCKPIPNDPIIGYLTVGKGISVHHQLCDKIIDLQADNNRKRLVEVSWPSRPLPQNYHVDIEVKAFDRCRLMQDIVNVMANDDVSVTGVHSKLDKTKNIAMIYFTIEIASLTQLMAILNKIQQLPNVFVAKRFTD